MPTDPPLGLIHFNHRVLDDQRVSWVTPGTTENNPNYGDMLVCAAIARQLAPVPSVRYMFGQEPPSPVGRGLVRGSTYLNRQFDFVAATRTLETTDAPLAVVGLGAQSPDDDPAFLDDLPDARRFVDVLVERSRSISVRGDFTAAVLERLGATDLRVTGCPSMFYSLTPPQVSTSPALGTPAQHLGVSLHTGLHRGRFCRNAGQTMRKHGRTIAHAIETSAEVSLFEQGVLREFIVGDAARPRQEREAAAQAILERFPGPHGLVPGDLVERLVSVGSVEDWLDRAREVDAMVGFRFHGNMVALTQGVPCFYFVYDSRITEFCRLYRLPHRPVEEPFADPVTAILEHDWDDTSRAIEACFRELVSFYDENEIPHRLGERGVAAT